jgi:hypothetical protein
MITATHRLRSSLSADLEALRLRLKDQSLTLGELRQALKGRGSAVLLILLALPFCFIAIPGLSTPFGIAIGFIGTRMVLGREPWLPRVITRWRLSPTQLNQVLIGAVKVARALESLIRPRLGFLHTGPTMQRLIGLGIVIASLGLMLPLPIPFSNNIPAWSVVFLATGMMEKDGLWVLLGHLGALGTWLFIGLTSAFAVRGVQTLLELF